MKKVILCAAFALVFSGVYSQSIAVVENPENKPEILAAQPLFIVDDKEVSREEVKEFVKANKIERISVFKNEQAMNLYGDKGRNGAVVILTKDYHPSTRDRQTDVFITRVMGL